jgi:hypothetical protein
VTSYQSRVQRSHFVFVPVWGVAIECSIPVSDH